MYSEGVTEVAKLAECPESHIRVKDARPGSIILHLEFLPSKTCCAEMAAARYIENITALTCTSEKDLESSIVGNLGLLPLETSRLMPLETLQNLGQVGAIEEFALPPKTLDDGEELKIWQHGNDKTTSPAPSFVCSARERRGWCTKSRPTSLPTGSRALLSVRNSALLLVKYSSCFGSTLHIRKQAATCRVFHIATCYGSTRYDVY
jgi:hypothetical protein